MERVPLRSRILLIICLGAIGISSSAWAHKPTVTTFTYHDDIFPIFVEKCGSCHRSGGVAPMSLLTYKEAYPWGVSIKNEVLNLAMPPWFADERYGELQHDAGLTATEMNTIVDWCLGGSPEGDGAALGSVASDGSWPLGEPDLVLTMPTPVVLDESTSEADDELSFATGLDGPAYLRAIDFQPGAPNIVRSASIAIRVEGEEHSIAAWIPGQILEPLSEGRGRLIPSGAEIVLRVHYEKTWLDDGTSVEDRSALGLYLLEETPATAVETVAITAASVLTLEADKQLIALLPRVKGDIEALLAEVVRPDGSREPILGLYHPSPDWPRKYWLEEPLALPTGTRVEVTVTGTDATAVVLVDLVS